MKLTKTDFLIYKDCAKNAWLKAHKPEIYFAKPLSVFDQGIIDTGNEVDELVRDLFPDGVLVSDTSDTGKTKKLIEARAPVIYQPVFETNSYKIICDILVWNSDTNVYDLYEVKASNSGENKVAKDKLYSYDIAFQYLVLKDLEIPMGKLFLTRLNKDYVRRTSLDISQLFTKEDFTEKVLNITDVVKKEMKVAQEFMAQKKEPAGSCRCITRGRSSHCTSFSYSNPHIPEYSVHDISRIGQSKRKLEELIDNEIFRIEDIPHELELSDTQRNQVDSVQSGKIHMDKKAITSFLKTISFPISFFDYETFPAGVPRFFGYSPYNQIPFQFSLHVLNENDKEPIHSEFIFTKNEKPDEEILSALKKYIPKNGSILVWYKPFEIGRNKELAKRNPEHQAFLEELNTRIIDLRDIFTKQYFIHPEFKGKTSIKYVLPVLAPKLSYKSLDIQEGATASDTWNKIVNEEFSEKESIEKTKNLLDYCKLDTYAMFAIWKYLSEL